MQDKINKLTQSVENLKNKDFTVYFFTIEEQNICASVLELYNQANLLRKLGYKVCILSDENYKHPEYIDDDMKTIPLQIVSKEHNLSVKPEDFLIVPEIFTNVLEQTKNVPCTRIVLAQSYSNVLKGLMPGMSWRRDYNIQNVITNNTNMTEFVKDNMDGVYDIKQYKIGIPDYFKPSKLPKDLVVSVFGRNPQDTSDAIKLFYLNNPSLRFISFQDLRGKKRREFAEALSKSSFALSVDRKASFGTFPLEAMKAGNIVIGLAPDMIPEYINENTQNGLWTQNIFDLPELIKSAVLAYIQDNIPSELYKGMEQTVSEYTVEASEESIKETYEYFFNKKEIELTNVISKLTEELNNQNN